MGHPCVLGVAFLLAPGWQRPCAWGHRHGLGLRPSSRSSRAPQWMLSDNGPRTHGVPRVTAPRDVPTLFPSSALLGKIFPPPSRRPAPGSPSCCGRTRCSPQMAHRDTFLKRTVPDSRREAHALPKRDHTTKHPGARHRPPRDRYFLRPRGRARRPRSLSNRPNMAPGRTAHV